MQEFLFPVFCLGCGREGGWLCAKCFEEWRPAPQLFCPVCYCDNSDGRTCSSCRGRTKLDGAFSFALYNETLVSEVIKKLKYEFVEDLKETIAGFLQKCPREFLPPWLREGEGVVIAVPLHPRREKERGFNQAGIIAKELVGVLAWPLVAGTLKKVCWTEKQVLLGREERRNNLAGAFAVRGAPMVFKRVILVDDVFTTGSTLEECARVLKAAGVKEVFGTTLARER
ncbi:MAG: ComF family protein [Candidatus Magasanikbacteria bacterium]|nr:ComF family protein [Candidatus Magasanikbacteria bacterium]